MSNSLSVHSLGVKKQSIPIKFKGHKLIPRPVPDSIKPSNEILQGRLCDIAHHISEWSSDILDASGRNKDWMPVNVTSNLLKSRLNMVLKAMYEYHQSLDGKPDSLEESSKDADNDSFERSNILQSPSKKTHIEIPQPTMPFLDSNFASAVAYQNYYPYYYQPQAATTQRPFIQQPPQMPLSGAEGETTTQPRYSPAQMQQLYEQQYNLQPNPIYMMPPYSPEQQTYASNPVGMPFSHYQTPPQQKEEEEEEEENQDNDFTNLLFEGMDGDV